MALNQTFVSAPTVTDASRCLVAGRPWQTFRAVVQRHGEGQQGVQEDQGHGEAGSAHQVADAEVQVLSGHFLGLQWPVMGQPLDSYPSHRILWLLL